MTEDELLSAIESEEASSLGTYSGVLSDEREKAYRYYLGKVDIPAPEGRSNVVSTDVRDAVEGVLPGLLRIFTSTDKAVEFNPHGYEDAEYAKQATEACNYVFYRQNNGFLVLYTWLKDGLIQKNGVVKYYYDNYSQRKTESYHGLTDVEFQLLLQKQNVQLLQRNAYLGDGVPLNDVAISVMENSGKVCVVNVPPEEFLISAKHNSVSIQDCPYVAHRCRKTISDLKAMGFEDLDDVYSDDEVEYQQEYLARRNLDEQILEDAEHDPSMREVWVAETYIRLDYDGDGFAELRKVLKAGRRILLNEETDHIPFAAFTPVILPHRFFGLSLADLINEIQDQKSVIWRQMLDSLYLANNPRIAVFENQVNLDDLLTSRPGGVVRMKAPPSQVWSPLEMRFVGQQAFPMMEYMDTVKENRTGVTRYNQGMDADSLNKTATGISLITNASTQRQELIARIFAETGLKDLFKGILHMLHKYSMRPLSMRLRNKYVEVDPRQWSEQWDVTINVGLGTGDKQQQTNQLMMVAQFQKELIAGGMAHLVPPQKIYNTLSRLVENAGYHPEEFIENPENVQPPPPQPSPEEIEAQSEMQKEQMKLQADAQKTVAQADHARALEEMRSQTQVMIAQMNAEKDKYIAEMKLQAEERMKVMEMNAQDTWKRADLDDREKDRWSRDNSRGLRPGDSEKAAEVVDGVITALEEMSEANKAMVITLDAIKKNRRKVTKVVRDESGNIVGAESA